MRRLNFKWTDLSLLAFLTSWALVHLPRRLKIRPFQILLRLIFSSNDSQSTSPIHCSSSVSSSTDGDQSSLGKEAGENGKQVRVCITTNTSIGYCAVEYSLRRRRYKSISIFSMSFGNPNQHQLSNRRLLTFQNIYKQVKSLSKDVFHTY
jgi:hypothetical protein